MEAGNTIMSRAGTSGAYNWMNESRIYIWALGTLLIGGICLGISPVIVKALSLPADVSAFFRVALSMPLFMIWALATNEASSAELKKKVRPRSRTMLYVLAAIFFAADLAAMHYAIGATSVAVATLFTNCAPFFVGVFGLLGLADRPNASFWKALPVALIGIVLLIGISSDASSLGSATGDLIALVAGALYAAYLVTVKELRNRGARPVHIMAIVCFGSTLILAPFYVASGLPLPSTATQWVLLLTLAIVGQAAGQGLVTIALQYLPVSSSSLILLIQPVIAALLSWILLAEVLSLVQMVGITLVLGSIYIALRPTFPRASAASPPDIKSRSVCVETKPKTTWDDCS